MKTLRHSSLTLQILPGFGAGAKLYRGAIPAS